ncbi:hypothetical protein BGZ61DRAFT_417610 [Ilyonectria robusta]|uniref:uncharacterized protein n=1 Tax=Ilyonectria robusta TaxID=1079257 RepID=UPI001E8CAB8B|nr:uncharacterized protein BGZ61DRAFT_417610 [Ilyonectria robusta]KAH8714390.1 hypothetical protein BGZ61DRAFT_417610 [Ilyonectria robusta]
MPRKHRAYRPKIKGCYECSQRRISCDRATPQCQKCASRGIECSGLGIRHRFNNGIAARGKWAGKTAPCVEEQVPRIGNLNSQDSTPGKLLETANLPIAFQHYSSAADVVEPTRSVQLESCEDVLAENINTEVYPNLDDLLIYSLNECDELSVAVNPIHLDTHSLTYPAHIISQPSPSSGSPRERLLLLHFSDHIAKEMVAIDGLHNGWRHLVLPIAHEDTLVMNAVLSVSAFHLSVTKSKKQNMQALLAGSAVESLLQPQQETDADRLYTRTIMGLRQRQELRGCDPYTRHSVLLAILVLLTAAMVTASEDFPVLFNMLQAALEAIGGEDGLGGGELADFMIRQIRKMRVYAAPLLSEQSGLKTLSSQAQMAQLFDCLNYCSQQRPGHAAAVSHITTLIGQAHEIYLRQAIWDPSYGPPIPPDSFSDSINRVERFKETLETFPPGSPGEQVLIWASFMAASDCVLEEHKSFFEHLLLRYYMRSGFVNVLRGLQHLRVIWTRRSLGDRWTSLLPQARIFLM